MDGGPGFGPRVCRHWATDTAAPTAAASALSSDANSASASFTDAIIAQSVSGGGSRAWTQLAPQEGVRRVVAAYLWLATHGYVLSVLPGRTACFTSVFPDLPPGHGGSVPVFGVATGLAGAI